MADSTLLGRVSSKIPERLTPTNLWNRLGRLAVVAALGLGLLSSTPAVLAQAAQSQPNSAPTNQLQTDQASNNAGKSAANDNGKSSPPAKAPPAKTSKSAGTHAGLSAAQAQQLLTVLDNPAKRSEFVTTLKNITQAQKSLDHEADQGLLDQAWMHLSDWGSKLLKQSQALTQSVTNFRAFGPWVHHVVQTSSLQGEIGRICLRVAIMIIGGLALSFGMAFLLRTPRRKIEEAAQNMYEREIREAEEAIAEAHAQELAAAQAAEDHKKAVQHAAEKQAQPNTHTASTATEKKAGDAPAPNATVAPADHKNDDELSEVGKGKPAILDATQVNPADAREAAERAAAQQAQENSAAEKASANTTQNEQAQNTQTQNEQTAGTELDENGNPISLDQTAIVQYDLTETLPPYSSLLAHTEAAEEHAQAETSAATVASTVDETQQQRAEAAHTAQHLAQEKAQLTTQGRNWQASMTRLMNLLRRVPFALGVFCLNLLSIMMFPLMAVIIETLDPTPDKQTLQAVWSISWLASVALGVWVATLRALFAPLRPWMRLIPCPDTTAWFFFRWLKRIGTVSSWGITALIILRCCTLPHNVLDSLGKLLMLIVHIMIALMIIGCRPLVRRTCARVAAHKRSLSTVMTVIGRVWWVVALFFDFSLWMVWAMDVPGGYQMILNFFVRTCVTLALMRALSILVLGAFERALNKLENSPHVGDAAQARITTYAPVIEKILDVVLIGMTGLALAVGWGVPLKVMIGAHTFGAAILSVLVNVGVSALIGFIIWEAANLFFERRINQLNEEGDGSREVKARIARLRTLQPMMRIILMVGLTIIIGLTTLSELGVNTAPLLAGASIFGVALGFGAQKLVQDFISGIFLLLENALAVGDAVTLNGTYGIVEKLSLRTVHVRGNDASMNIFPFSSLTQTINYNRDFARALIVADVAYDSNIGDVVQAFKDITAEMRADPDYADLIIDDFQLWGVSSLNDSTVTVKGSLPTVPAGRWPVERDFNRRMLIVFPQRGIDFPFPTRTLDMPALDTYLQRREQNSLPPSANNDKRSGKDGSL